MDIVSQTSHGQRIVDEHQTNNNSQNMHPEPLYLLLHSCSWPRDLLANEPDAT